MALFQGGGMPRLVEEQLLRSSVATGYNLPEMYTRHEGLPAPLRLPECTSLAIKSSLHLVLGGRVSNLADGSFGRQLGKSALQQMR